MFFGSTKSVEKLRKLSLFRAEKWCIIKIALFQVSEKQEISEKHQRFGFSILSELGRFAIIIGL